MSKMRYDPSFGEMGHTAIVN